MGVFYSAICIPTCTLLVSMQYRSLSYIQVQTMYILIKKNQTIYTSFSLLNDVIALILHILWSKLAVLWLKAELKLRKTQNVKYILSSFPITSDKALSTAVV